MLPLLRSGVGGELAVPGGGGEGGERGGREGGVPRVVGVAVEWARGGREGRGGGETVEGAFNSREAGGGGVAVEGVFNSVAIGLADGWLVVAQLLLGGSDGSDVVPARVLSCPCKPLTWGMVSGVGILSGFRGGGFLLAANGLLVLLPCRRFLCRRCLLAWLVGATGGMWRQHAWVRSCRVESGLGPWLLKIVFPGRFVLFVDHPQSREQLVRTGEGLSRHVGNHALLDNIDDGLVHHAGLHGVGVEGALSDRSAPLIFQGGPYDADLAILQACRARVAPVTLDLLEPAVGADTALLVLELRNGGRHFDESLEQRQELNRDRESVSI